MVFKGCLAILIVEKPRFQVDFVNTLSYLAARPSLEPRPLQEFNLFFPRPTDRRTITRDGAMGNETFYWDGLSVSHEIDV